MRGSEFVTPGAASEGRKREEPAPDGRAPRYDVGGRTRCYMPPPMLLFQMSRVIFQPSSVFFQMTMYLP